MVEGSTNYYWTLCLVMEHGDEEIIETKANKGVTCDDGERVERHTDNP